LSYHRPISILHRTHCTVLWIFCWFQYYFAIISYSINLKKKNSKKEIKHIENQYDVSYDWHIIYQNTCTCISILLSLANNDFYFHQSLFYLSDSNKIVCLMVFNTTFNNISVSWWSVLLVEETGGLGENHRPVTGHWQTLSHNIVHR
jgi:hypothetical protein